MRTVAALILLVLASCAGPSVSQVELELVPLIKAERYDEAATDPDLLAPAFVEALRQLNAEEADPKRVMAVADALLDHYPLSRNDIPVESFLLSAVADEFAAAASKLQPELSECRGLFAAGDFRELCLSLESLPPGHVDGERCARRVVGWLRRAADAGPCWNREESFYSVPGIIDRDADEAVGRLVDASIKPLAHSRYFPFIALLVAELREGFKEGRWESWNSLREHLETGRWRRLFFSRLTCLGARRFPLIFEGWTEVGREWESSRFDPKLRILGRTLAEFATVADNFETQDFKKVPDAARRVIAVGRGTPFPDAARYAWIAADLEAHPAVTDDLLMQLLPEFDHPFLASEALIERAGYRYSLGDEPSPAQAAALLDRAARLDPPVEVAARAISFLADMRKEEGREAEKVELFERVLAMKEKADPLYAVELSLFELQSDARRGLARHYQSRGEWSRALEYWQAFEPVDWCLNGIWAQEDEREMGLAFCFERLNRIGEALPCYWRALEIPEGGEDAARRLLEIYREREALPQMMRRVAEVLRRLESVQSLPGLRWLAAELGVTTR